MGGNAIEGSSGGLRNTGAMMDLALGNFERAHAAGVMGLSALPLSGRGVSVAGRSDPVVDFIRCSYLGLDNHPALIRGAIKALEASRALHWSCARTRMSFSLLAELEAALSDHLGAHVICYSTVLAANMGALPLMASGHLTDSIRPHVVFDRFAHATLAFHKATIAAETSVSTIAHNDLDQLEALCRRHDRVVYVCDGIYSMGGAAPIEALRLLQERHGLFLYIDDAHGISLFGRQGEGYARSQFPAGLGARTIIAASLGKGFGASGGLLMLGTPEQEALFRRFSIAHAFSASLNIAAIGAALASLKLHRSAELARLQMALGERLRDFDRLIDSEQKGLPFPIRTINLGSEDHAIATAAELLDRGYFASAIFFPTVARGRAGLRFCVTATHTADEIAGLARALSHAIEVSR